MATQIQDRTYRVIPTLDLVTPMPLKQPGVLIAGMNHEPTAAGATRIDGFERVDGQTKASAAVYYYLAFTGGVATIAAGATVTGASSAASGKALIAMVVTSGSFGTSDAAGYLVLSAVSGTFTAGENLQVGAVTKCVLSGTATLGGALNDTDNATWSALAQETQRALIGAVPGSGVVRGGWVINGVRYSVRDNAGGTAGALWKSTSTGWQSVSLGRRLAYTSGGTYEPQVGDVITGVVSGATATLTRVTMTGSSDFTTGLASGYFYFASQTGVFQAESVNIGAHVDVASIGGDSSAITLPAGGRYEGLMHNFYALSSSNRFYGVNGVGPAFEFDGTTFVLLDSPVTPDTPNHIGIQSEHLVLHLRGGRIIGSGDGVPDNFTAAFGAFDLGLGDDCTGMIGPYNNGLIVAARNHVRVLLGHDVSDMNLDTQAAFSGCIEWTLQIVNRPTFYDDAGVRDLTAAATFGNFNINTLSRLIEPMVQGFKALGVTPVASLVCKRKSHYRVFLSDGKCICIYFGAVSTNPVTGLTSLPQILVSDLGKVVSFATSMDDGLGNEVMLFGSDDGYLYELDSGNNFDGAEIEAYFRTTYDACKSPDYTKRFHSCSIQGSFGDNIDAGYAAEYSFADADQPSAIERTRAIAGAGGFWSEYDNWNDFNWSAAAYGKAWGELRGRGENFSLSFITNLTYERPYSISAMSVHFSLLARNRRKVA
jgi:hypothetical protein